MKIDHERRRHPRYSLPAMYTPVTIRTLDESDALCEGHAYDLSMGGLRFELDRALVPGTPISISVVIPRGFGSQNPDAASDRIVFAYGQVAWTLVDPDEPGPVPMAARFTRFVQEQDAERLREHLASGRFSQAA